MTALGIRYLMGCAVSSDMTRQRCEFPPHPGRVFMAMAAAHFQTGEDVRERRALEWLESQSLAPSISTSEFWERRASSGRLPVETYVPVNDKHGGVAGRSRQPRSFPTVRINDERVFLIWKSDAPADIRDALDGLCSKVTRIGHSSSVVQMWLLDRDAERELRPSLTPDEFLSEMRMRIAEAGTLAYLEKSLAQGERPRLARWRGYTRAKQNQVVPAIEGPFDSRLIILEKLAEGRVLGLESTLQLTGALRNAAMRALPEGPSPEWLSGHQADGSPSLKPHVAFFPLPFVDARYADGHVLGMAMAIPRAVPPDEARRALGALLFHPESGEEHTIHLWRKDGFWDWNLRRETRDRPPTALRAETWTEASDVWASVTPVVLHHYPKKRRDSDVERILSDAFISAGFPEPKTLCVSAASIFEGAPHARSMPEFTDGGEKLCRYQVHASVEFGEPVRGPVLVGRGRFRGYGLFRPVRRNEEQQ